jgi:lysozyme
MLYPTFSPAGYDFIRAEEGFRAKPYWDVKGYSAGYGTFGVDPNVTVTKEWAENQLRNKVQGIEGAIRKNVKVPLNQGQFDALVSYGYNLGEGYLQPGHTLIDRLNAGDYAGAADAFGMYNKAGGKTHPVLSARRAKERALFSGAPAPIASSSGNEAAMPSPYDMSGRPQKAQGSSGVLGSILGEDWGPILGALGIGILQGDDIGDGVARGMSSIMPMMQKRRDEAKRGQALQSLLGNADLNLSPTEMGYLTQDPELGGAVAQAYIKKRLFPEPEQSNTSSLVADLKAAGLQPGTPQWQQAILAHYQKDGQQTERKVYKDAAGNPFEYDAQGVPRYVTPQGQAPIQAAAESTLDKRVAAKSADLAETYINAGDAAEDMLSVVQSLKAFGGGKDAQGNVLPVDPNLSGATGALQGTDWYQNWLGSKGSADLYKQIDQAQATLVAGIGRAYNKGMGSQSDAEGRRIEKAVGDLKAAQNADQFNNILKEIETSLLRQKAKADAVRQKYPQLDIARQTVTSAANAAPGGGDYSTMSDDDLLRALGQ